MYTTRPVAAPVFPAAAAPSIAYERSATSPFTAPTMAGAKSAVYAKTAQTQSMESPWGGGCPWQYDKTAFKTWLKVAMENPKSSERKELFGYLSECFLDADSDRDGLIGVDEFDFLIEKAASMPRRFGLAPNWVECYGDVATRQQARMEMFRQMDRHRRGKIGTDEWIAFTMQHISEKVKQIDWKMMDFCHLENAGPDQFLIFLASALSDKSSEQYKSLYEFLFKTFVESDVAEKGAITRERFDILIEDAAQAPRALGLAPPTSQTYKDEEQKYAARQRMFEQMDVDGAGAVTFDNFLNWTMSHIAVKVSEAMGRMVTKVDAKTAPWGGGCAWQFDKTAFKSWLMKAIADPSSKDRKELYGYLSECFLDADGDRDGLISTDEFDFLIEKAAAMPRRFGMAPSWVECYGDISTRSQARGEMFKQMDKHQRGKIGMEEWVAFSIAHITEKVKTINWGQLDFAHLEMTGPANFVKYLEQALADRRSEQYKSLYEFLYKTFVESDVDETGAVSFEQFDVLIEAAAQAPRTLGLAPTSDKAYPTPMACRQARQAEFDQMDTDRSGSISFDKFLNWALTHIAGKVTEYRSKGR